MSIQMIIGDSRSPNLSKYRHVLHRGANPCGLAGTASGPSGHAGVQLADLPPTADVYKAQGLPATMNPGLFLDSYKNDLHVFIHTRGHEDGSPALWLESATIADLPLNQPITVGVICNGKTVEIYVNCKLYTTMILRGRPYLPAMENMWFGRYCAFPMSGLIKNLQLWADALSSDDYKQMCAGGDFSGMDLPTTCPTAPAATTAGKAQFSTIAERMRAAAAGSTV
jgi:hypothetical protein